MLLSSHYDEKCSLLILQFGGVYSGAEALRASAEFVKTHKTLPRHCIYDFRTVTTADLVDSDGAFLAYVIRSLPFPVEQVRSIRGLSMMPADPKHPMHQRVPSMAFGISWSFLTASDDPEHDWQEALSLLDLPSTIEQPY